MTQRDLPISEPTFSEPPKVTASLGAWSYGLGDHVTDEQFAALKSMAGLTLSPDVLEINGHNHQIEHIAVHGDVLPTVPNDCPTCYPPSGGPYTVLDAIDNDQV